MVEFLMMQVKCTPWDPLPVLSLILQNVITRFHSISLLKKIFKATLNNTSFLPKEAK